MLNPFHRWVKSKFTESWGVTELGEANSGREGMNEGRWGRAQELTLALTVCSGALAAPLSLTGIEDPLRKTRQPSDVQGPGVGLY